MQQLGRYQVLRELATGGIADVLLARASGLEGFTRHVVIKRIRRELAGEPRFVQAFLDEARIAASLHHHNIVQVYDIGEDSGAYFFAMEYVHCEDVRTLLAKVRERKEHVPLDQSVAIITATAAGLHYAHEALSPQGQKLGVIHRDVSPSNILVGYDGSVKLVDFGLAKAALRTNTTAAGTVRGKASYMSPEQCRGEAIDRRADIFGLGIVLYELLTAQRLFKGATDFDTMHAVVEGDVPPPSTMRRDVPPALDAIVLRALAKDPNARYQTAEEFREAVEKFAVAHQLRTSNKALADYVVKLFGQRPEPWETAEARKPLTEDTQTGERGLVQPRNSAVQPAIVPVLDDDDDDDDAVFDGEPETTVMRDSQKMAAQLPPVTTANLHGDEPTTMGARVKSEADEQKTVVGAPIFDVEEDEPSKEPTTALDLPLGRRASRPATALGAGATPPSIHRDRAPSPRSSQPLPPTHGSESQRMAVPPYPDMRPVETTMPIPKVTSSRLALLIGAGGGIVLVVIALVVMRACGG